MDKPGKSDINPTSNKKTFAAKLGGMPKTLDVEQIIKVNNPGDRKAAPGSFRPGGNELPKDGN